MRCRLVRFAAPVEAEEYVSLNWQSIYHVYRFLIRNSVRVKYSFIPESSYTVNHLAKTTLDTRSYE